MPIRKRGKVWYIDIHTPQGRIQKRASTSKAVARRIHDELVGKNDLAKFGIAPDKYSLSELKGKFLQELQPRVKAQVHHDYTTLLNMAFKEIGNPPLNEIRHRLNMYIVKRKEEGKSAKTLNRTICLFKRMLAYGVQTTLIPYSPVADVPLFSERREPRRSLTLEEVGALLKHSGKLYPVWLAFLTTGLRRSELVYLTWDDVDLGNDIIYVRASKTEAGVREIPIAGSLRDELLKIKGKVANPKGYVFTTGKGTPFKNNLLRVFKQCIRKAEIEPTGLNIHSLRHTFATLLGSKNVHPKHIQELLGHKSALTSMDVYMKVFKDDLRDAVNRLGI